MHGNDINGIDRRPTKSNDGRTATDAKMIKGHRRTFGRNPLFHHRTRSHGNRFSARRRVAATTAHTVATAITTTARKRERHTDDYHTQYRNLISHLSIGLAQR